jgi:hypothetical protein
MPKKETKVVRGILGVRKSAKSQVLLFGRHAEPLPSDDSEDSDYEPTNAVSEQSECPLKHDEKIVTAVSTSNENNKKKTTHDRTELASVQATKKTKHRSHSSTVKVEERSAVVESKRRKVNSTSVLEFNTVANGWSDLIPSEVLLHIFAYCVETQGAVPLLSRYV